MTQRFNLFITLSFLIASCGISFSQFISSINPSNANLGQSLPVSISGQNTNFGQGTSTTNVWFSQGPTIIFPSNTTIINTNDLTANFSFPNSLPTGYYDVNVSNSIDGIMTVPNGFLLNPNPTPPVIIAAAPDSAKQGQSLTVTITGQYTNFTQGTSTANVWFQQGTSTLIFPSMINVVSDTKIIADFTIPFNAPTGYYDVVTLDDIDGLLVLPNGFYVDSLITDVEEFSLDNSVEIYPNPSSGIFTIQSKDKMQEMEIINVSCHL